MYGMMLGYGFLGALALVLFLTFAASGITWLVATVFPGASPAGRRSVGMVAGISAIALAAVLIIGAVLTGPDGPVPGPRFRGGPMPLQPAPGQPGQPPPTR